MGIGYQRVDRKAYDYDLWFPDGQSTLALRGPRTRLEAEGKMTFIGAAQTFGRFVETPFAAQVGSFFESPTLNLGFSGAGPEFYLKNDFLMNILQTSETVVVQSMSARSVTAGIFEAQKNNGVLKFLSGPREGETMLALEAYRILRKEYGEDKLLEQITAVQQQWIKLHRQLAKQVKGRKIFLWLSETKPGENIQLDNSPLGIFPHFVNEEMVSAVQNMGFEIVECILKSMPPQILVNDKTGIVEPVFDKEKFPNRPEKLRAMNSYYATPELHDLAAKKLIEHILILEETERRRWKSRLKRFLANMKGA